MPKSPRLGELLIQMGFASPEDIEKAIEVQKKESEAYLGSILVKLGAISEQDLATVLSKQLRIPFATKAQLIPMAGQDLDKIITEEMARRHLVLPISIHMNSLTVAMADPADIVLLDNLHRLTGYNILRMIALRKDIEESIGSFYGEGGMLKTAIEASYAKQEKLVMGDEEDSSVQVSLDDLVASAEKAPVIKLTDLIIRQAIKERASDIHIEPFPNKISIRFRIDGVLQEIPPPDKSMMLPLISRIKILSKMDIAEKRLPQDGSFRATIENRSIDFRVSTIPTVNGEKMVLRILDRSSVSLNLENLGFSKEESEVFRRIIHKPYGMVLLTGPTGSGKTTTLYSALSELKGPGVNILTIEDPVEYQISGINQVQVKPSIGLTFAAGLRAFLRQDPDIILVGETRDMETAQICVRAALTGHLVFSTLHTNDAPTAINRLIDIGIEPFFVTASLLMVVAQRLVRRLCPKCKEPIDPAEANLPIQFRSQAKIIYRPVGCDHCSKTGYRGRIAIFEMMVMNDKIEEMALRNASAVEIHAVAKKNGMQTLEESGYKKVLLGETSVEEIFRLTAGAL